MKTFAPKGWLHWLLLLGWIVIGTALRFTHLEAKPPWADEFATLVFSLGNSFRTVPLDRAISVDTLLLPLQPRPEASLSDVFHHLMTESTHPPVYFMLSHLWLQLFSAPGELVSLWAARALSAVLGVAAIPAMFGCGWLAFRSRVAGQLAAAMMAVSPYGIYQAQEPRHYTLAILFIIASLCCLVVATRSISSQKPLPIWLTFTWVGINSLGIAVHYFFTLTLVAEAVVLVAFIWHRRQERAGKEGYSPTAPPSYWRFLAVAAGTVAGGLVWLPYWQSIPDSQVTDWIYHGNLWEDSLQAVARLLAWIISMLWLLPVQGVSLPVALICGGAVIVFTLWALPLSIWGEVQLGRSHYPAIQVFGGFVVVAIALFLLVTYTLGADLTIAARYHFVYFPAIIALIGAALASCWNAADTPIQRQQPFHFLQQRSKKAVILMWLMGLFGALTVVFNFGYQKIERADLLVPIVARRSQEPILIASAYNNYSQIREIMTLGWEFKRLRSSLEQTNPLFLLARQAPNSHISVETLYKTLAQLPKPLDLWIVNFGLAKTELDRGMYPTCTADSQHRPKIQGYRYKLYHCR